MDIFLQSLGVLALLWLAGMASLVAYIGFFFARDNRRERMSARKPMERSRDTLYVLDKCGDEDAADRQCKICECKFNSDYNDECPACDVGYQAEDYPNA